MGHGRVHTVVHQPVLASVGGCGEGIVPGAVDMVFGFRSEHRLGGLLPVCRVHQIRVVVNGQKPDGIVIGHGIGGVGKEDLPVPVQCGGSFGNLPLGMIGVDFHGRRYDMGNKLGILEAIVEQGAVHSEVGEDFKSYLKEFVKGL